MDRLRNLHCLPHSHLHTFPSRVTVSACEVGDNRNTISIWTHIPTSAYRTTSTSSSHSYWIIPQYAQEDGYIDPLSCPLPRPRDLCSMGFWCLSDWLSLPPCHSLPINVSIPVIDPCNIQGNITTSHTHNRCDVGSGKLLALVVVGGCYYFHLESILLWINRGNRKSGLKVC